MAKARPDPNALAEWLRRRAPLAPERPALTDEEGSWTYGELGSRVERPAAVFAERGVGAGDRVAYLGANHRGLVAARGMGVARDRERDRGDRVRRTASVRGWLREIAPSSRSARPRTAKRPARAAPRR